VKNSIVCDSQRLGDRNVGIAMLISDDSWRLFFLAMVNDHPILIS